MDLFILYLQLIAASILGQIISLIGKNKTNLDTVKKGEGIEYSLRWFLGKEVWNIVGVLATISMAFLVLRGLINSTLIHTPNIPDPYFGGWLYISRKDIIVSIFVTLFITIGYMGMDISLKFLGKTSAILKDRLANSIPTKPE